VLTRHWNHRDSDTTKVDENSTSVVFVLERVSPALGPALAEACDRLVRLLTPHADRVAVQTLTPHSPSTNLST
jgi:DNA/RNA-binding domain of Phe-tRNA-synthetase-like protein